MDLKVTLHDTHGVVVANIKKVSATDIQQVIAERNDLDWILDSNEVTIETEGELAVLKELTLPEGRLLFVAVNAANTEIEEALDDLPITWAPTANEAFDLLAMAQIERELGL